MVHEGEGWEGRHQDRSRDVGVSGPRASVLASFTQVLWGLAGSLSLGHWLQHLRALPEPPPALSGAQPEPLPLPWGKHRPAMA